MYRSRKHAVGVGRSGVVVRLVGQIGEASASIRAIKGKTPVRVVAFADDSREYHRCEWACPIPYPFGLTADRSANSLGHLDGLGLSLSPRSRRRASEVPVRARLFSTTF